MTDEGEHAPGPDRARDRAAWWHVRLESDAASEADWLAFEAWLAQDLAHRRAYEAMERALIALEAAPDSARGGVRTFPSRMDRRRLARASLAGAGLAAAGLAGFGLMRRAGQAPSFERTFAAAPGRPAAVTLPDGSRVTLNGGSRLRVRLGQADRRARLFVGEALFEVRPDAQKPFWVEAGARNVRVVGTQFNVIADRGDVSVAVREGVVEIHGPTSAARGAMARLGPGRRFRHDGASGADRLDAVDPGAVAAWTLGHLVFREETLASVARTLERYGPARLEVDPEVRALKVTAVLNIGDQERMLAGLTAFLPLELERRPNRIRLRPKR